MRARILITALLALASFAPAAAAATKTETATRGPVSVVLTYDTGPDFQVSHTHVKITRAGATLLDADVAEPCRDCAVMPAGASGGRSLRIVDLDADGEPEVLLDLYTGGTHCCYYTWIYRYTGTTYTGTAAIWGDVGYTIVDLRHNGKRELRSYDDRFAYAFTDYADTWFPQRIWRYHAGRLTDVTRHFHKIVAADARRALRTYRRYRRSRDIRGVVAGYVADEYLLGHGSTGWRVERSAQRHGFLKGEGRGDPFPRGAAYGRYLRKFLRRNGYSR